MPKSVFTGAHLVLVQILVEARKRAGLTQTQLAQRLGKDQSFISLIERSQRRVDTLEFYALARALGADPVSLFAEVVRRLPARIAV
jgi:transcriptional regulator with XRE-family HTH domain